MTDVLLIDIGNTNLKWAWSSALCSIHSVPHLESDTQQLIETCWLNIPRPERVLISNVAGKEKQEVISQWMGDHWQLVPEFVHSTAKAVGVTNGYRDPSQLGVDRWLTLLAVKSKYERTVCVVDCGTAITIDVVDQTGQHWGGLILPGLRLKREAIFEKTHIPRKEVIDDECLLDKDSHSAIASASLNAAVALVEKVMTECERKVGYQPELVFTGRDAIIVSEALAYPSHFVPDLVMQGLHRLAEGMA